jgi:replicative DNA helicase
MSKYLEANIKSKVPFEQVVPIDTRSYKEIATEILSKPKRVLTSSGIKGLNDIMGGFDAGRLYVLSAPTKQGKTTMAQTLMYNMALEGIATMIFEYEMGQQETIEKFMDMDEGLKTNLSPSNFAIWTPDELHRGGGQLQYLWIYEAIEKAITERDIKLVVIDHLHFLLPLKETQNTSFVIGGIVREIKRIAVALNIPIILIAHTTMLKDDKLPDWTDIRDSSFITQEADVVLMMYRAKNKNTARKVTDDTVVDVYRKKAILSVELNRCGGKTGKIALWHDGNKFIPYSEEHVEEEKRDGFIEAVKFAKSYS